MARTTSNPVNTTGRIQSTPAAKVNFFLHSFGVSYVLHTPLGASFGFHSRHKPCFLSSSMMSL